MTSPLSVIIGGIALFLGDEMTDFVRLKIFWKLNSQNLYYRTWTE